MNGAYDIEIPFQKILANGALPVDPIDLAKAFTVITSLYQETTETGRYAFKDHVATQQESALRNQDDLLKMLLGLKDWYHEESQEKFLSLCWRIFALCQLIREQVLSAWVNNSALDRDILIPGVVIRTAASIPLNDTEGFNQQDFIQALRYYKD